MADTIQPRHLTRDCVAEPEHRPEPQAHGVNLVERLRPEFGWAQYEGVRDPVIEAVMVFTILGMAYRLVSMPNDPPALRGDEWLVLQLSGAVLALSRLRRRVLAKAASAQHGTEHQEVR